MRRYKSVLVVGQNPGSKPHVFGRSVNGSLRKLDDWMAEVGVDFFSFSNVVHEHGKKVSLKSVDKSAWLCYIELENTIVLGLGNFVSKALDQIGIEHFKLPHPSGLNRQLNDKNFERRVLKECKHYIEERM